MTYKLLLISGIFAFFILLIPNVASADVCADVPKGGAVNYVINETTAPTNNSCTFDGTVNGVDGVGITIDEGYSLTINSGQTIAWSPGKSVIINGSIAITTGGQLKQTYLWMKDADNDGYPPDATQYDTEPADGKRRKDFTNFNNISDITYDFDDDPATGASIFPGQACEDYYGAECTTYTTSGCDGRRFKKSNTNAGTCTTDNPIESDYDDACTDVDCGTCCKCSAATAGYDGTQDGDCPAGSTQYQEGGSPNYCQSRSLPGTCASLNTCSGYGAWGNINAGATCGANGGATCCGSNTASGNGGYKCHTYKQCSSGTCTTYTANDGWCGACKLCSGSSCVNYGNSTSCGSCRLCSSGSCKHCYWKITQTRTDPRTVPSGSQLTEGCDLSHIGATAYHYACAEGQCAGSGFYGTNTLYEGGNCCVHQCVCEQKLNSENRRHILISGFPLPKGNPRSLYISAEVDQDKKINKKLFQTFLDFWEINKTYRFYRSNGSNKSHKSYGINNAAPIRPALSSSLEWTTRVLRICGRALFFIKKSPTKFCLRQNLSGQV